MKRTRPASPAASISCDRTRQSASSHPTIVISPRLGACRTASSSGLGKSGYRQPNFCGRSWRATTLRSLAAPQPRPSNLRPAFFIASTLPRTILTAKFLRPQPAGHLSEDRASRRRGPKGAAVDVDSRWRRSRAVNRRNRSGGRAFLNGGGGPPLHSWTLEPRQSRGFFLVPRRLRHRCLVLA